MANEIHNVLEAARAAIPGAHGPAHGGGPKPVLFNPTYVQLAVWIADQAAPALPKNVRAEHDSLVALARKATGPGTLSKEEVQRVQRCFVEGHTPRGAWARVLDPSSPLVIAHGACFEALECHIISVCGKGARLAAAATAKLLGQPFLDALDREIVRLDAVTALAQHELDPGQRVEETVWRGVTGSKTTQWVVRLADGTWGLLARVRGKWRWSTGSRDDIVASVPDAQFTAASAAALGQTSAPTRSAPSAKLASLDGALAGVSLAPGGGAWVVNTHGRLGRWTGDEPQMSSEAAGGIAGISAGDERVLTWGAQLTQWTNLVPKKLAGKVDGALMVSGDRAAWWSDGALFIDGKRIAKVEALKVVAAGDRVFCLGRGSAVMLDGSSITALPVRGDRLATSRDGTKLAAWRVGKKHRTVTLLEGVRTTELEVDEGNIGSVAFSAGHVLVGYHSLKRVQAFDLDGRAKQRIAARELGKSVDEVFPLARGAVLGFSPFPHGEVFLLDLDAQVLGQWRLGRFYSGGRSCLDERDSILFGHTLRSARLIHIA